MHIRIEGHDLPARLPSSEGDRLLIGDVHVGVQCGRETVSLVPATASSAVWEFEITSRVVDELLDVGGPWVHGRPGARFLYLGWGAVTGSVFAGFRRAKLMFTDVPGPLLLGAHRGEGVLVASLGLTDARGEPRCARVRPPDVVWSLR